MTDLRQYLSPLLISIALFLVTVQTIAAADLKIKAKVPGIT